MQFCCVDGVDQHYEQIKSKTDDQLAQTIYIFESLDVTEMGTLTVQNLNNFSVFKVYVSVFKQKVNINVTLLYE